MTDLDRWLQGLGLGQYAAVLAKNDVDAEILPELTELDLEKLGFSLGHRKKLLKAIMALRAEGGSIAPAPAPPPPAPPAVEAPPQPEPEPTAQEPEAPAGDRAEAGGLPAAPAPEPEPEPAPAPEPEPAPESTDRQERFRTLFGLHRAHFLRAKHAPALDYAAQCLELAEAEDSDALRCVAHRGQAAVLCATGRFAEAQKHAAAAMSCYRREDHAPQAGDIEPDPGVAALAQDALARWYLGHPARAAEAARAAAELAASVNHASTETYSCFFPAGLLAAVARDMASLAAAAERLGELAGRHRLPQWVAVAQVLRGCATAGSGDGAAAAALLEEGLGACRELGFAAYRPLFLGYLAEAHLAAGSAGRAAAMVEAAIGLADATGERSAKAELLRLKGCIAVADAQAANMAEPEESFRAALDLARECGSRALELRAATSLARLWRQHGRRREAHNLLARIYGAFTEGFDTPDLKEAKALLTALR